jgi:hypothetical protein
MTTEEFFNKPAGQLTDAEFEALRSQRKVKKEIDRKAYKDLVNETVPYLVNRLKELSDLMSREKGLIYNSLIDILKLKLSIYQTRESNQSHTFSTEDGWSVTIGYRIIDGWDDTVNAGISKINEFIGTLSKDENSAKLVKAINRLLKKDAKGNLKANRVIELQALADDFNNEVFTDGVDIIRKAYKPVRSAFFIDSYYTDKYGIKQNIPLSLTSVDFPTDFDLSFLLPEKTKQK